ncbi:site-specific integrase [Curvibacter sp. RS43]|uniref:site-specific integrase n=1 Tax=Curvibacter microcysteis TaxID=3026419 RepID=UPI00236017B4|nr:site-specific integrase [Curvibacter sp. RS43]MDD0812751.1 site-specific integrase [Curvibacter sp. RS43]
MAGKTSTYSSPAFAGQLGRHHFAHLRCVAEGVPILESALRYLGIEHGKQALAAHRQAVDAVQAIARKQSKKTWRLIGLTIRAGSHGTAQRPTLQEFIEQSSLEDWSEEEALLLYEQAFPADRKSLRNQRLRNLQHRLLTEIESSSAETPRPDDAVSAWFDDTTAAKLAGAGVRSLDDLHQRIQSGGRWYAAIPAIGAGKAERIASHLTTLLPQAQPVPKVLFNVPAASAVHQGVASQSRSVVDVAAYPKSESPLPSPAPSALIAASSDLEAIEAWISTRANSPQTAKCYRREAHRLLLWLRYEADGIPFGSMRIEDCRRYQLFLGSIPSHWMSKRHLSPGTPGWAPFRGQLSHSSRKQSLVIVSSMFAWLVEGRYLASNPWALMGKKKEREEHLVAPDSKVFSEDAVRDFLEFLQGLPPSPSRSRMRFILLFVEAVGLRSSELLDAKLGDLRCLDEGWFLQVHGKGSKNRLVAIPKQAFECLNNYLIERGLGGVGLGLEEVPLLASAIDPMKSIGYQALYETVKIWVKRFVSQSKLGKREQLHLSNASTHWLRHTFGTRAAARHVPLDVIQAQLGHASIATTANIYGRAPIRRRADALSKAFA